jgi:sugar-specific transcriptional regulator TrmB
MAKQDVYRIMPLLQNLGLAEKIVAAQFTYKATPVKEGVYILLRNATRDYVQLQEKASTFLDSRYEKYFPTELEDEDQQFIITCEKTLLLKKLRKGNQTAKKSIDTIEDWGGVRALLFYYRQDFADAINRGVRVRIITEKHENTKLMQETLSALENPLFEIRYISGPLPVKTVIYDEKEVNMCIAEPPEKDIPSLWSSNPRFTKIMLDFFEKTWKTAVKDETEKKPSALKENTD